MNWKEKVGLAILLTCFVAFAVSVGFMIGLGYIRIQG